MGGLFDKLFRKGSWQESKDKPNEKFRYELGDGYYLAYEMKSNGYGGYCDVNVCLYEGNKMVRQMTDEHGKFKDFPGVEHGDWEKELIFPFEAITKFTVGYNPFGNNGLAEFVWMVQPDGRYWGDDGFGMEKDKEIMLYAKFDKTGRFVTPFKNDKLK